MLHLERENLVHFFDVAYLQQTDPGISQRKTFINFLKNHVGKNLELIFMNMDVKRVFPFKFL